MNETEWLALCVASETNQPHEWPYVAWAIRNRVEAKKFPNTYEGVILQPWQFSYFNAWTTGKGKLSGSALVAAVKSGYAGRAYAARRKELEACAAAVMAAPPWQAPFGADVMHYYSPVSMNPAGSEPAWADEAKRLFTPPGVDPERFVFAAGVP